MEILRFLGREIVMEGKHSKRIVPAAKALRKNMTSQERSLLCEYFSYSGSTLHRAAGKRTNFVGNAAPRSERRGDGSRMAPAVSPVRPRSRVIAPKG